MTGSRHWKSVLVAMAMLACAQPALADGLLGRLWPGAPAERFEEIGGAQILVDIDMDDFMRGPDGLVMRLRDNVRRVLTASRMEVAGGIQSLPQGVSILVPQGADQDKLLTKLRAVVQMAGEGDSGNSPLGLTVAPDGTIQLVYTEEGAVKLVRRAVGDAAEVLSRRITAVTGKAPGMLTLAGGKSLLVQLPGCKDPAALWASIGMRGGLEFRFLARPDDAHADTIPYRDSGDPAAVERRVIVGGADLDDASFSYSAMTSEPQVSFKLNRRGTERFAQATADNVGRQLAIVFDGQVYSAPRISAPITEGMGVISGSLTSEQAKNFAMILKTGALPARLQVSMMQSGLEPIKVREKGKEWVATDP